MDDETQLQTTGPIETATEQPTAPVAQEPADDTSLAGSDSLNYLHRLLRWLKDEFEAIGLDIKAEIEKL